MIASPLRTLLAALVLVTLAACGTNVPRLDDAPVNTYASPVGYKGIRYWGDSELKKLNSAQAQQLDELRAAHKADPSIPLENAYYLAISGGGGDGAFGAGILNG